MPIGDPKYTSAQRDAVELHYVDRDKTARAVAEMAAAGELTARNGEQLDAFPIPINTIRDIGRKVRKRRAGRVASPLADKAPRDALENLRRRLVNLADRELAHIEKKRAGTVNPEQLRQVTRVVLELARLPGPTDPRPPSPGTRDRDGKAQAPTGGGLAGPLLKAHRAGQLEATAQSDPHHGGEDGERMADIETHDSAAPQRVEQTDAVQTEEEDGSPGSWAQRQARALSLPGEGAG